MGTSDATRFSEVVAGPGPRGTPTFDDGLDLRPGRQRHAELPRRRHRRSRLVARHRQADSGAKVPQWGFPARRWSSQGIVTVFAGGPEGKSVLGYHAKTGELAWSAGEGTLSYCSPQLARLDGVEQLLIATEAGLTAFRARDGRSAVGP